MPYLREPLRLKDRETYARLMRVKKLTVRGLAERAGCSATTVHRLKTGQNEVCYRDTAEGIAEALEVDVDALFEAVPDDSRRDALHDAEKVG